MFEYVTESIVLAVEPRKEYDLTADLFTRDLGRLKARVVSGRKILSKFSSHLNPLNLVSVRLVEKKQFTITDVLTADNFSGLRNHGENYSTALNFLNIVKILVPFSVPDIHLWHFLRASFEDNTIDCSSLLKILGYDSQFSSCAFCFHEKTTHFSLNNQIFLCSSCNVKINTENTISISNSQSIKFII